MCCRYLPWVQGGGFRYPITVRALGSGLEASSSAAQRGFARRVLAPAAVQKRDVKRHTYRQPSFGASTASRAHLGAPAYILQFPIRRKASLQYRDAPAVATWPPDTMTEPPTASDSSPVAPSSDANRDSSIGASPTAADKRSRPETSDTIKQSSGKKSSIETDTTKPSGGTGGEEGEEDDEEEDEEDDDEDEEDDDDEEDEEEEEEEDDDDEPRLKYARLTQHLGAVYRNGDATSAFLVAGDKMVRPDVVCV